MKRAVLIFVIAALVLITCGLLFFSGESGIKPVELLQFGVIILVIAFALFFGYKRFSSAKSGQPVEDELSKKVLQKAAAFSFYISLYLWVAIIYISDKVKLESHSLIGAGVLGMAVIYAICWVVINFTGIKNE
jgi:peptidoglycan/LPS O-acetylase OafA/YrhL